MRIAILILLPSTFVTDLRLCNAGWSLQYLRAWEGLAPLSPFRLLEFSEAGREGGKTKIQVENRIDTHLRLVYFDVIPHGVLFAFAVFAGLIQRGAFSKLPRGSVSNTLGWLRETRVSASQAL